MKRSTGIFELIPCPVCGAGEFKEKLALTPNEFLGPEHSYYNLDALKCDRSTKFFYQECLKCGFVCTNPRLKKEFSNIVYNEAKSGQLDKKDWAFDNSDLSYLYNTHHKWRTMKILLLALIFFKTRFSKPKNEGNSRIRLLDYGSGFGHVLDLCKGFGVEGKGIEIDENRITHCIAKGLQVTRPEGLPQEKFDIVVSTSVIEHAADLHEYFQYISSRLMKKGIFIFDGLSPDIIKVERRKEHFKNVHPIEHVNMFTRSSLIKLASKYDIKPIPARTILKTMNNELALGPFLIPFLFFRSVFFRNGYFSAIMMKH